MNFLEPAEEDNERPCLQEEQRLAALPRAPPMPSMPLDAWPPRFRSFFKDYLELVDSTGRVIRAMRLGP